MVGFPRCRGMADVVSVYWSIMTLTSIGYGDVLPVNTIERVICCFGMVLSGFAWTYVLGTVAGIAATLDPNAVLFHTTMDHLFPHGGFNPGLACPFTIAVLCPCML